MEIGEGAPNFEARKDGKPHELITKHLGLEFKSPPREIPLTVLNRLKHWKTGRSMKIRGEAGVYFHESNTYFYEPVKNPKHDLAVRLHESAHALYAQINPEIKDLLQNTVSLSQNVGLDALLYMHSRKLIDDNEFYLGLELKNKAADMATTHRFISEGIAEWTSHEVMGLVKGLRGDDLTAQHLSVIASLEPLGAKDSRALAYIDGHRFVTYAIFALQTLGVPRGEALLRLMLNPPKYSQDLEKGGVEYAAQELMVYS